MTDKHGPAHILIVDDEPSIIELIRRKLTSVGYSCVSVADGDTGTNMAITMDSISSGVQTCNESSFAKIIF